MKGVTWEYDPPVEQSLGLQEPYMQLAANILRQALVDYWGLDLVKSIDALLWLIDEAPVFLVALDIIEDCDEEVEDVLFRRMIENGQKKSLIRRRV